MPPPSFITPVLAGICQADGTYAYAVSESAQESVSLPSEDSAGPMGLDSRFEAQPVGMAPLFSGGTPEDRWEARRRALLEDLARPFPPEQYEARERLIQRLQAEGLNAANAAEIGKQLEPLGLIIPRPPRAAPLGTVQEGQPMPRISAEMEREAIRALEASRPLRAATEALPEIVEVYRFEGSRKIRSVAPLSGSAYSPMDRALIVVDGNPGGVFSISDMNRTQWDEFRSAAVQRGYAVTNPRADGSLRTDARTLEYHIIADSVDAKTIQYLREYNSYVRVIRYGSVADVAAGRGEILVDSPRQYLRSELMREGTLHEANGFVEVRQRDVVVRRFQASQVTSEFHHYLGRLSPERAAEARSVAAGRGWDFSRMTRQQAAEFLSVLQGPEHRWTLEDVHSLIGSEGMRSYYGYGTERPFGFETTESFRAFRMDIFQSLESAGLPIGTGEVRVILSGSAISGFSAKGGEFRWNETTTGFGYVRPASDYDVKVIVPQEVFNQCVEQTLAAQSPGRPRRMVGNYIGHMEGIRWAETPPAFQEAMRPLMERYPRIHQVTIALEGGYWHVGDPMADALNVELTEGTAPLAESSSGPVAVERSVSTVRTGWEEVLTHRVNDRAVYESLSRVDRALAEYYRTSLSTTLEPAMTIGDLVSRAALLNPQAVEGALAAATREGLPITQAPERALFELISRCAEAQAGWRDSNPTMRSQTLVRFETEVRRAERAERPERDLSRETEERRQRERREAERSRRP